MSWHCPRARRVGLAAALILSALLPALSTKAATQITYLGRGDEFEREVYERIIHEFTAANPGIEVRLDWIAGSAPEIFERVLILTAAGTPPDAYWIHSYSMGDLVALDLLYPLDALVSKDSDLDLEDYYPATLEEFTHNGRIYGLPRESSTTVLTYNVDSFNEAGIATPGADWTWETLLDAARKLTHPSDSNPKYGIVAPTAHANHLSILWQNGGRFLNDSRTESVLSSPASVEAAEWIYRLMYEHQVAAAPHLPQPSLARGNVAMAFNIRAAVVALNDSGINWDAALLPAGKHRSTRIASAGHGVHAKTGHEEAAYRLVKFLSGPVGVGALAARGIIVPPLRSVAVEIFTEPRDQVFYQSMDFARPEPVTPDYLNVIAEKDRAFARIWRSEAPIESTLVELDRIITARLRAAYNGE